MVLSAVPENRDADGEEADESIQEQPTAAPLAGPPLTAADKAAARFKLAEEGAPTYPWPSMAVRTSYISLVTISNHLQDVSHRHVVQLTSTTILRSPKDRCLTMGAGHGCRRRTIALRTYSVPEEDQNVGWRPYGEGYLEVGHDILYQRRWKGYC